MAVFEHQEALANGLNLRASEDPASPALQAFYAGYDRAFVLPDEREDLAGFSDCLRQNLTLPSLFGRRHSEQVLVVTGEDGTLLGGANFLATGMTTPGGPPVSLALNYVFVEAAARGRGLARVLIAATQRMAALALTGSDRGPEPAVFIEQNDPLALSAKDYAADTAHAGIDQVDRLAIWASLGARLVDFPYVQPALSADQEPDDNLIYAALRFPADSIPPGWFHDHLQSFFGVSVRKGAPLAEDPVSMAQLDALAARSEPVRLIDVGGAIAALKAGGRPAGAISFRQFAGGRTA
jgi:GNAT superfamily N-acetyltransferase